MRDIAGIFFRPARFFARVDLDHAAWYRTILLLWGLHDACGRIDQNLMRADLGRPKVGWGTLGPYVLESWLGFWACLVVAGLGAAAFHWYIAGWWYRVRLNFSGAREADPRTARLVMTYAGLVIALPTVILLAIVTLLFPNYEAYWNAEELLSLVLLVFPCWSIVVSYRGVRTRFAVSVWKSRVWFLILPLIMLVFAMGLATALYVYFE